MEQLARSLEDLEKKSLRLEIGKLSYSGSRKHHSTSELEKQLADLQADITAVGSDARLVQSKLPRLHPPIQGEGTLCMDDAVE